jgi:hypothetical protein
MKISELRQILDLTQQSGGLQEAFFLVMSLGLLEDFFVGSFCAGHDDSLLVIPTPFLHHHSIKFISSLFINELA